MERDEVMARRIAAQQLDRAPADRPHTDAAVLDLGVQETGRDAASWALVNRGVPVAGPDELEQRGDLALVWTLRGAPHFYRRSELRDVLRAVSPFSEADAAKRTFGAAKPLTEAGITSLEGLDTVAAELRRVVTRPMVKGDVSGALNARLPAPYLRHCNPCNAVHIFEQPFRFATLFGGLELEPGTSPPVMRRIPDWPRRKPGPDRDPTAAPAHLRVIEGYLRFLGPAAPAEVAAFVEAPVAAVKAHWPAEAVEVTVGGLKRWAWPGDVDVRVDEDLVRLLGSHDLLLQGRDRAVIVPDTTRHKALWPVIGRPGAILVGTEIVGTWRPRAAGQQLSVLLDLWRPLDPATRQAVDAQAERLAEHRGVQLKEVRTA